MRTKEAILSPYRDSDSGMFSSEDVAEAMDAYAKEVSIDYSHWILKKMYPYMANGCAPDPEAQNLYERYKQETSSLK